MEKVRSKLISLGFFEKEENLFEKIDEETGIAMYHDFRKGCRQSYAYKDNKPFFCKDLDDYKVVKAFEEDLKIKIMKSKLKEDKNVNG